MSYFPNAPLPVRVFLAPGYDPTSPTSWTWTEVTSDVRFRSGVTIETGRRDEASHADPGKCTLTLNNRSGNYSTRNAMGIYYGDLRRNTPLQIRVDRLADTFTRTSASGWGTSDSGFVWAHTSASKWTVDGSQGLITFSAANQVAVAVNGTGGALDVDIEFVASIDARTTGANWLSHAIFRYSDINNFYLAGIEFATDNTIQVSAFKIIGGVSSTVVAPTATGIAYSANTKIRVRVVAHGANIQVKAWLDGGTEPSDWNLGAQDTDLLANGTAIGMYQWRIVGNTNAGSLAVKIDSYTASAILFTGLVSEWPARWNQVGTDCTVPITANGVLRRLQRGSTALNSPLYRQLLAQNPAGYWPCEDSSGATQVSSPLTGALPASVVDVTFAAVSDLAGADPVLKVNSTGSRIAGAIPLGPTTPDGYAAMFLVKFDTAAVAANTMEWFATGTVYRWVIDVDALAFAATGYDSSGAVVVPRTNASSPVDPTDWTAVQLETLESGGTVTWSLIWNQAGSIDFYAVTGSYAGTAERIISFRVATPQANTGYAHIWAGDNDLPFADTTFSLVSSGYAGEHAEARIERLCDDAGVAILIEPTTTDGERLGVQHTDALVSLLQDAEDADQGILYERGGGLAYRPRAARYNAAVNLALNGTLGFGDLAAAPEPTDDDQRIRNDVTVKRAGGGQGRAVSDTSIAEVGTYAEQATLSLFQDSRCDDQASWRVYLGTRPELRWPRLEMDFGRQPGLIDDWLGCTVGARVTVSNPPSQLLGEEIDLIVEGHTQRLNVDAWQVTLTCSPAIPWQVGVLGTAMVDTAGSALTSDITSAATSISVTTTTGPIWSTSGTDFDILVGGERMTCTAISGSSSPQTFTVTRAVNGVAKAHDAGTAVNVYRPLVAAL